MYTYVLVQIGNKVAKWERWCLFLSLLQGHAVVEVVVEVLWGKGGFFKLPPIGDFSIYLPSIFVTFSSFFAVKVTDNDQLPSLPPIFPSFFSFSFSILSRPLWSIPSPTSTESLGHGPTPVDFSNHPSPTSGTRNSGRVRPPFLSHGLHQVSVPSFRTGLLFRHIHVAKLRTTYK